MGGTDLNLAASVSSSATSGAKLNQNFDYGDVFTGGGRRSTPSWIWLAVVGAVVVVASLFIVRK